MNFSKKITFSSKSIMVLNKWTSNSVKYILCISFVIIIFWFFAGIQNNETLAQHFNGSGFGFHYSYWDMESKPRNPKNATISTWWIQWGKIFVFSIGVSISQLHGLLFCHWYQNELSALQPCNYQLSILWGC